MQTDNQTFLQVLRIQDCELWNSKGNAMTLDSHGDLQIIYSSALDQFVLKMHDFKVLLDKSIDVISSVVGYHKRQAFLLASREGFSMFRLTDSKPHVAVQNLETIFENTTNFSHKSGLDSILSSFKEIQESGLKGSIMKISDAFSKVLTPSSENESHPNQKLARSFDELKDVTSTATPLVDISRSELADLKEKLQNDSTTYQKNEVWTRFSGHPEGVSAERSSESERFSEQSQGFSGKSEKTSRAEGGCSGQQYGNQRTSDIRQMDSKTEEGIEISKTQHNFETCKFHPSIDSQEVVGAQNQRLPSYEVHNSQEHKERGLRKASVNLQGARDGTIEPAEPEDFEDEAFTTGLLTKNYKEATNIGTDKDFPVSSEDAFADLTHPMRKHSSIDRPFLNIDDEPEHVKTDNVKTEGTQSKGGFTGQPIITAKGQPNLKSDIDDQPSPISSTEKYTKETSQTEVEPMKPSNTVGQENIVREASQGNETKKQKKFTSEPVDKENVRATTAI